MAKLKFAAQDFKEEDLPQTRREQFFSILKNQYKVILIIGLILIIFASPIVLKSFFLDYYNNNAYAASSSGALTPEEVSEALRLAWIIGNASNLILYPLLSIAVAGILRVIKLLVYGDVPFFKYDFSVGVKDNIKQALLLGLFIAIFELLFNFVVVSFPDNNVIKIVCYILFLLVVLPGLLVSFFYSTIYKNKIFSVLKDSYFIYLKGSWRILILMIIGIGPFLALEIALNFIWVKQLIYLILIFFLLPLSLLAAFMVINNVFDIAINKEHFPEIYRKGLYIPKEEKQNE